MFCSRKYARKMQIIFLLVSDYIRRKGQTLFLLFCFWSFSSDNGPGLDRDCIGHRPAWYIFSIFVFLCYCLSNPIGLRLFCLGSVLESVSTCSDSSINDSLIASIWALTSSFVSFWSRNISST